MPFKPEHHARPEGVWHDKEDTKEKIELLEDVFERATPAFEVLTQKLRDPIFERRWASILGDDVSGRLPALVIGHLMERVARERGERAPGRFFIVGPSDEGAVEQRNLQRYLHALKKQLGSRTLVVTEYMQTGETIHELGRMLKNEGVDFDVVTLSVNSASERKDPSKEFRGISFYVGSQYSDPGFGFWQQKTSTGVEKEIHVEEPVASRNFFADPELVGVARKKAKELANELYKKYFVEKPQDVSKAA